MTRIGKEEFERRLFRALADKLQRLGTATPEVDGELQALLGLESRFALAGLTDLPLVCEGCQRLYRTPFTYSPYTERCWECREADRRAAERERIRAECVAELANEDRS